MKKTLKTILLITTLASLSLFNGCEDLADIPLNIPFPIEFTITGSETSDSESTSFCLNQYEEWNDNKDKIKSVKFLSAAYWTLDYAPENLTATINASVQDINGITLFSFTLTDVSPGDASINPYKIELSSDEIDAFNAYLNNLQEDPTCMTPSFTAQYTVSNVSWSGTGEYTINGKVEIVLETVVSVD